MEKAPEQEMLPALFPRVDFESVLLICHHILSGLGWVTILVDEVGISYLPVRVLFQKGIKLRVGFAFGVKNSNLLSDLNDQRIIFRHADGLKEPVLFIIRVGRFG